jgi:hypothetical protein
MPGSRLVSLYPELDAFLEAYHVLNPLGLFDNAFTEQMGFRMHASRMTALRAVRARLVQPFRDPGQGLELTRRSGAQETLTDTPG